MMMTTFGEEDAFAAGRVGTSEIRTKAFKEDTTSARGIRSLLIALL
jgi:hypothetical protein